MPTMPPKHPISPSFLHLRRMRENPALMDRLPCMTEAEASRMLGLAPETVKRVVIDCVKAGLLEAVRGPEVDESLGWLISSPSCNALYWQLEQATTRTPFPTMIRLQKAIQTISAHNQKMVNIIERILKHLTFDK